MTTQSSPTEPIRYGIIGTGMMGCEHILNIGLIPDARVTAIADPNETSRGWGKSLAGDGVEIYADYRELLQRAAVDAVVVASPNFTHFEVLQDVFQTHKHVLVEKPLCTDVEDCRFVLEAAARHPGVVWVGMEYRYMRAVGKLVEIVHAGDIGRLWMLAIREHRLPFLTKVDNWNRFARNTGGTLVEKCCHFFDLMTLITRQRPVRAYGSGGQNVNHLDEQYNGERPDILDNAYVIVDFDQGARAMLDLCMFAENSTNEVELAATGDRGKAEVRIPAHRLVMTYRDGRPPQTLQFDVATAVQHAGAHHGATYFEHLAFIEAVRGGGKSAVSAEDGALAVAVGVAAERSIIEQRPVELGELGF
ncbi:MAG TPA: Gfo/Idh/MocA family oxidoreductase [Candidatus Kryptonia bacterium]|nr:Gfo/Idh/MocA family oxidoreductase [Candidatus Kryptonia bacterium]